MNETDDLDHFGGGIRPALSKFVDVFISGVVEVVIARLYLLPASNLIPD